MCPAVMYHGQHTQDELGRSFLSYMVYKTVITSITMLWYYIHHVLNIQWTKESFLNRWLNWWSNIFRTVASTFHCESYCTLVTARWDLKQKSAHLALFSSKYSPLSYHNLKSFHAFEMGPRKCSMYLIGGGVALVFCFYHLA